MRVKGIHSIVGKHIQGVIVKESTTGGPPAAQLFIMFTDGTYYEIYSSYHLGFASGLDHGGRAEALRYMDDATRVIMEAWEGPDGPKISHPE